MTIRRSHTAVSEAFGASVRALRRSRGWYQRELAELAAISLGALKHAEQGHGVTLETAVAIARALGVSVDALLADPTGRHDSTPAIQALIDTGAGTIPRGVYKITTPVHSRGGNGGGPALRADSALAGSCGRALPSRAPGVLP